MYSNRLVAFFGYETKLVFKADFFSLVWNSFNRIDASSTTGLLNCTKVLISGSSLRKLPRNLFSAKNIHYDQLMRHMKFIAAYEIYDGTAVDCE